MGILNFKLSKEVPIDPPQDSEIGADYVTTFYKEQSRGDFPLKDEMGRIKQQVRLHGDYLISKMGTSEEGKRKGYENFYRFLKQLPPDMKLVYRKPNEDPYDDNYYRKLGFEKKLIGDHTYYLGESLSEVQSNTQTYMRSHGSTLDKPDKNPQLIIPYLDSDVVPVNMHIPTIEDILNYLRIHRNRCMIQIFEADFHNNLREMIAALNRARTGRYEVTRIPKGKIGGGSPTQDFADDLRRLENMVPMRSPIKDLADKIAGIRTIDEYEQVMNQFSSEWRRFKADHPEVFQYESYGQKYEGDPNVCMDILEARHGKDTAQLAKKRFKRRIDQIYALTNRDKTLDQNEQDQRIKFLAKFGLGGDVETVENALIANDWDVLHAADELDLDGDDSYILPDDFVQSMLNAHKQRKVPSEQHQPREVAKYLKLQIMADDGKIFVYDSTVVNSPEGAVALNADRFAKWRKIIDLYNKQNEATSSNQQVKITSANLELKKAIADYNEEFIAKLNTPDFRPKGEWGFKVGGYKKRSKRSKRSKKGHRAVGVTGGDESGDSTRNRILSNAVAAAVIIGLIVVVVIHWLMTRYDTEFPDWIHGFVALASGIVAAGAILAYGYHRMSKVV